MLHFIRPQGLYNTSTSSHSTKHSLTLFCNLELFLGAQNNSLQHLMGADVGLKVTGVPELPNELTKPLHQYKSYVSRWPLHLLVVVFFEEVISQWTHVRQWLWSINEVISVIYRITVKRKCVLEKVENLDFSPWLDFYIFKCVNHFCTRNIF